jgi:hypothetical protein
MAKAQLDKNAARNAARRARELAEDDRQERVRR